MSGKWQIDDVLGVWPLHGLAGAWGGIKVGIFGLEMLGGLGGVSFISQLMVQLLVAAMHLFAVSSFMVCSNKPLASDLAKMKKL